MRTRKRRFLPIPTMSQRMSPTTWMRPRRFLFVTVSALHIFHAGSWSRSVAASGQSPSEPNQARDY
jgi:hypothetical protein